MKKQKTLKYFLSAAALSLFPVALLSARCENTKPINDNHLEFEISKHGFKNFNKEYTIQERDDLLAYRIKNKNEMIYIDVDQFLNALSGLVDEESYNIKIDENNNEKIYEVIDTNGKILNKLVINWEKNTIFTPSSSFFFQILKARELTDSGRFLQTEYESKNEDDKGITFDLSKYKMDILYKDKKVLIPFSVFNTLFMSWAYNNIYFNGDTFTNVEAAVDIFPTDEKDDFKERIIKDAKISQLTPTKEEREANFNHLMFAMDYFYGLKQYKEIKSFEDWIGPSYKEKLLSINPEEFHQAYIDIFHKKLNELHTRINTLSYYDGYHEKHLRNRLKRPDDFGDYFNEFNNNRESLVKQFEEKFKKKISEFQPEDYIRYHGNTAIVTLLRFKDGTAEEIASKDAWKHDTYFLMRHLMAEVAKKPEIKNIVLDIAINGGGSVLSMIRTLGFMTDKPILNREYNVLDQRADLSKSKVDTNGDGKYDGDAYDKYNWSLLVGMNSFSAANQLTSIVKEMGIAKIIGQKSGGGMSAIMPIVLNDGTTITISSPNNAVHGENNQEIESGIEPDIKLDYKDFYNDAAIDQALNASRN
ncbi:S41 family peptidase [Metamycoplasma alkalescens]|uniref:Peptidase S41-like protein n=4 Tax=Metamycoplasma alkalescens TaxID=45363 RepID=A0A318U9E2_9BACT|nr:S41 family peptidase [Metamycoplasma alkalescens]PYF43083.1 peptidase S41-like protein [Metamycoplasma alkalescens]